MAFLKRSKNEKVFVILDIGGASVCAAIVIVNPKKKTKIIAYERKPVNFLFDINLDASLRCVSSAVSRVLSKVRRDTVASPEFDKADGILCVFSSPWFVSQAKKVTRKENDSFEIKSEMLERILEEEVKKFKENHPSFSGDNPKGDMEILEHSFMKMELNGYLTDEPVGKKAKSIATYLYLSLGLKDAVSRFKKEIDKTFPSIPVYFKTMPTVSFGVLSLITNIGEGFSVVNIGGETTDLYVIKDDHIKETITFSRGANNFFRRLSVKFNITPRESVSFLSSVLKGHRTEEDCDKVKIIAEEAEAEWTEFFEKALKEATEGGYIPPAMFLMSGDVLSPSFRNAIEQERFAIYTDTGKPFKAVDINANWFKPHMPIEKNSASQGAESDDTLMMEIFFAKNLF